MGNSDRLLFMILSYSSRGSVLNQKLAYIRADSHCVTPHIDLILKVIVLKLCQDMVPSSSTM